MKSLTQFINESKEKPMYEEWEIHSYVDYMLKEWFNNNQNYASILSATDIYNKKELVKSCEIAVTLLECLADVVKLHFVSVKDNSNKHRSYSCENAFYKTFKVIEAIVSIEFEDDKQNELEKILKTEIEQLKERVDKLVKNCNDKYDKWLEEQKANHCDNDCCSVCVPCDCCGCASGCAC